MTEHESSPSYREDENMWDEAWPTTSDGPSHPAIEPDDLDELSPFPETTGTTDPIRAIQDQDPYVPATDPPVLPGGPEGIHVATGFGLSAEDPDLLDDVPAGDEEIRDEALLVLRQDALTSQYALDVDVNDGFVTLKGQVPTIDDADHAMSILMNLPGVVDVIDETTLEPSA